MKFLVCDISGEMHGMAQASDAVRANSPVQCLNQAIIEQPDSVVIRFGDIKLDERDALVELCCVLKQNPYTRDMGVIALLRSKHRRVMEQLRDAGVEDVKILAKLDPTQALTDITSLEPESKNPVNVLLELLCPYLHYSRIDSWHEMTVCGAYLDRMVLGGQRLEDICETRAHLYCENCLNPRFVS